MIVRAGIAAFVFLAPPCWAGDGSNSDQRAWVNYALSCQGCHLPDAMGMPGKVPRMNGFVGYFLHSDAGRRFIIQVPGVSKSELPDDQLSELMNWVVREFSADQLPDDFVPFTAAEVGELRGNPVADPVARRSVVLADLAERITDLPCYDDPQTKRSDCQLVR